MRGLHALWPRLLVAAVLAGSGVTAGAGVAAANDTLRAVAPVVTPFSPNRDGLRDVSGVRVSLARDAALDVLVLDLAGGLVRRLATGQAFATGVHVIAWDGRNGSAQRVANAAYRFRVRASNGLGVSMREAAVTVADRAIYPADPHLITVAIDPGHGGRDTGAVVDGTRESDLNLDISLRLAAMLRGAGVRVVLLRDRDVGFNVDGRDRTGDGRVDRADDLQERLDIVNVERPDVLLIVMNNASRCHCYRGPGVWRNRYRVFGDANDRLARILQEEFVRVLRRYETAEWKVRDTGVHDATQHHEMASYDPATRPRPGQMPTVMGESLYLDQPAELALLRRPGVRQAIADAYFEAVARYVGTRAAAVRYRLVTAPGTLSAGGPAELAIELANRTVRSLDGATLRLGLRPDNGMTDGTMLPGTLLATVAIGTLRPAARRVLTVRFAAPRAGRWRVVADVVRADGARLATLGSPMLQIPIEVLGVAPSPSASESSPSPSASVSSPAASASPSASPSPSPPAP